MVDGSAKKLLSIRRLSVAYAPRGEDKVRALQDVRLDISAGEIVGIVGQSGCGKTTLANAIVRLLPSRATLGSGEIYFCDRELLGLGEPELRKIRGCQISLVPQDPALSLNPVIPVGVQVAEVLRAHLPMKPEDRWRRVKEVFAEVGLDSAPILKAYPHQLSGGQRQRVAIAQAIACRPALIIADEPTSKLDAPLQAEILKLLAEIREQHGTAVLFISHSPSLFLGFADRVAVIYAGRIVELGPSAKLFERPLHPYTQLLIRAAKPLASRENQAIGSSSKMTSSPGPEAVSSGCDFEPCCPERMQICACNFPQEFTPEARRSVSCFKYAE
ncbi:MAG TPA: ABC transporter ATP-binding protein [Terriglobales bacterium]